MAVEQTLSILKPDATRRNLTGAINAKLEAAGLRIVAQKRAHLTREQIEGFYAVHKARPFFNDLCSFMISGPVVLQVLEGENAVLKNRDIMGATNPANAAAGTIRKEFAESIEANSVHGSDSLENAAIEIAYFFSQTEIVRSGSVVWFKKKAARWGRLFYGLRFTLSARNGKRPSGRSCLFSLNRNSCVVRGR